MNWNRFASAIPARWLAATMLVGVMEGLMVKLVWWPAMAVVATVMTYPRGGPPVEKLDYHALSSLAAMLALGTIVAFLVVIGRMWRYRIHGPFWIGAVTVAAAQACTPILWVYGTWADDPVANPLLVVAAGAMTLAWPGLATIPLGGAVSWLVLRWFRWSESAAERDRVNDWSEASITQEQGVGWWRGFLRTPIYWVSVASSVAMFNGIMIKLVWWAAMSPIGARSPFGLSSLAAVITILLSWSVMMLYGRHWQYRVPTPFWFGAIIVAVAQFLIPLVWDASAALTPPDADLTRRAGPLLSAVAGILSWAYPGALTIPLAGTISYLLLRRPSPAP